jgi:hypothetical protein
VRRGDSGYVVCEWRAFDGAAEKVGTCYRLVTAVTVSAMAVAESTASTAWCVSCRHGHARSHRRRTICITMTTTAGTMYPMNMSAHTGTVSFLVHGFACVWMSECMRA